MIGFVGGRDAAGNVQFPKSRIPVRPRRERPGADGGRPACRRSRAHRLGDRRPAELHARSAVLVRARPVRQRRARDDGIHRRGFARLFGGRPGADAPSHQVARPRAAAFAPISGRRRRSSAPCLEADDGERHQGQGRDRRHGLHDLRRALGQGPRGSHGRGLRGGAGRREDRAFRHPGRLDGQCARRHQRRQQRAAARPCAAPEDDSGLPGREHVRDRNRGAARRRLRRRGGRGRFRAGARRREAQGHRLRRPAAAHQGPRQRPLASLWLRARLLRPACGRLCGEAPAERRRPQARHGACELEEPPERGPKSARPSAQGRRRRDDPQGADDRRPARPLRLLRRVRRRRRAIVTTPEIARGSASPIR